MYYDNDVMSIIISYRKDIIIYEDKLKIIKKYFNDDIYSHQLFDIKYELLKDIVMEYKFNKYNLIKIKKYDNYIILLNIDCEILLKYNIYKIKKDKDDNIILYLQ